MLSSLRTGLSVVALFAGLGLYYAPGFSFLVRLAFLVSGLAISVALVYFMPLGVSCRLFFYEAFREIMKVVWPSRKEVMQTTFLVTMFCFIVGLYLWLTDKLLSWVIYSLILGWI